MERASISFSIKATPNVFPKNELDLDDGTIWYLPPHPVISEAKGGKMRVVMDCSAKLRGISLNNQCLRGPNLTNKLLDVLVRFRQHEYAIMADVESMYMQVRIPLKDRNALRFLWFDETGNFCHHRMTSHLFGGVWSSSSSTHALRKTCQDFEPSDLVYDVIKRSFYVDDLLRSASSVSDVRETIDGTRSALSQGGFNLTKFVANDAAIMSEIDVQHRADEVKELATDITSKALGVIWDVNGDNFCYVNRPITGSGQATWRLVLSQVSMMHDPLGLITPIILRGRMIFQDLCRLKLGWDVPVPLPIACKWQAWLSSLKDLASLHFDRCLIPVRFLDGAAELVHFSDASQNGYGACSYLRVVNRFGEIHVNLIISKGRLAPMKIITIPRLELCAAVLAVRQDVLLRKVLDIPLVSSTFFTDSEIVLAYVKNETKRFKVFVSNRVSEIRQASSPGQWFHVKGVDNPADVLSRGCNAAELLDSWSNGPEFLHTFKSEWSHPSVNPDIDDDVQSSSAHACDGEENSHPVDKLIAHYGSFYRLKKAVAWLLRLKDKFQHKPLRKGLLSVS